MDSRAPREKRPLAEPVLEIGSFAACHCGGVTRRAFLQAGALALGGLTVPRQALAGETAKAKSIVVVWLWGGSSQLDTFDPKPHAPAAYRGPFSTIATRTPGIRFCELLPKLAERSQLFSLVRTNRNLSADHLIAGSIGLSGAPAQPTQYPPNFGSIVARHRGDAALPPFISMSRGPVADGRAPMEGYGGGTWGKGFDPFLLSCSEDGDVEVPALRLLDGLSPARLFDRETLVAELDEKRRGLDSVAARRWTEAHARANALLTSAEARGALDLARESPEQRHRYGHTSFGQSCLLARRLVEAEVPYIQVNWSQYVELGPPPYGFGWDTHAHHFNMMTDRHLPIFDRAFSAFLDDLHERGLLSTTLVVCLGEFGRTPKINSLASRDHWPDCYCSLWSGGGIAPGRVIGESDARAEQPRTEPFFPASVGATMLELAGLNSAVRAEFRVLEGARVIHELL
ncbi:MAG: DUF1501 domain-containing protein [Planctomycetia bacterium]|nr:DUF1501 domain-containing protein [Planctomycetia bacterium]